MKLSVKETAMWVEHQRFITIIIIIIVIILKKVSHSRIIY